MQLFRSYMESGGAKEAEPGKVHAATAAGNLSSSSATPLPVAHDPASLQREFSPILDQPETPARGNIPVSLRSIMPVPSNANGEARRFIVIQATPKKTKKLPSDKHLNPRVRLIVPLLSLLLILVVTLFIWLPLSDGQNSFLLPKGLNNLLQSAPFLGQFQAHQGTPTPAPISVSSSGSENASAPLPRSQYVAIAEQDATNVGISPTYFVRQINQESGFNPNAYSPGGAEGIAQFLPGTAAGLGINPWDPVQALQGAAQLMANLYHQYGDYAKALASYNAGSGTLQNAVKSCGTAWLSCMPGQTQNYVAIIMGS